jgi:fumarylpyruvate hydrolase
VEAIWLDVNGARRQSADLSDMIWSVPEIISSLSELFQLIPGDIIMTGTPPGVTQVLPGDYIQASIESVGGLSIVVAERA